MKYITEYGILIIGSYGSLSQNQPAQNIENYLRKLDLEISGTSKVGTLPISSIVWIKT